MDGKWESWLARWQSAGLIDSATAAAIRRHEAEHAPPAQHRLAIFAFAFGGILLGAGVLLFVASHWDELSPALRFGLVLSMVGFFHVGGALAGTRQPALATTLHAVGTAALGAGIFLAGQIFHMAEHWPAALLVWSVGAAFAVYLLRDWPQALWVAVLVPAWLTGEWGARILSELPDPLEAKAVAVSCVTLVVAYIGATGTGHDANWRRAIAALGAIALVPAAFSLRFAGDYVTRLAETVPMEAVNLPVVLAVAVAVPALAAFGLRGRQAWPVAIAAALATCLVMLDSSETSMRLLGYLIYAAGSIGLVLWGLRERERLRINLGVLGFALTVLNFYFGSLFDMLGRSLGLIGMGVLFIGGGWLLERARRQLVGRITEGAP
ncbi:MAG: DUF2157 domain-containing protein [Gammaproteobacteria bacterium]|nr:DUF2157 domain-containing protein [Gammaproteobacteria bacterium]